jgi:hypothetical protein
LLNKFASLEKSEHLFLHIPYFVIDVRWGKKEESKIKVHDTNDNLERISQQCIDGILLENLFNYGQVPYLASTDIALS